MAKKIFSRIFMDKLCRDLHPDFKVGTDCLNWFEQALDHCSVLLTDKKEPYSNIWPLLRTYIFASSDTQVLDARGQSSIHPNRLNVKDCNSLLIDIGHDYVANMPRFYMESKINSLFIYFLYATPVFMALVALIIAGIPKYRYYYLPKPVPLTPLKKVYTSENRCLAVTNRNLRRIEYQLEQLKVNKMVQPEELLAPDGSTTLVLKVSWRMSIIDGFVVNEHFSSGRLYRIYELANQKKPDYKTETVLKIKSFMDSYTRKMKVIVLFDEMDANEEEILVRRRSRFSPPSRIPQPVFGLSPINCGQRCGSRTPLTSGGLSVRSYHSTPSYISPRSFETTRSVNATKTKKFTPMTSAIPRTIHRYSTKFLPNKPAQTQLKP